MGSVLKKVKQNYIFKLYIIFVFQIMVRAENAHAYVNAGFRFNLLRNQNGKILTKPTIVFGGINPTFVSTSFKIIKDK